MLVLAQREVLPGPIANKFRQSRYGVVLLPASAPSWINLPPSKDATDVPTLLSAAIPGLAAFNSSSGLSWQSSNQAEV